MTPRSAALLASRPTRYVLVGGLGYLFEMAVLYVASTLLRTSDPLAVTTSFWLGLVFSFLLQKVVAFGSREARADVLGAQTGLYAVLVLVNYAFTLGFTSLAAPSIGVFLSRTIALGITTGWNYFAYRNVIFNTTFTGTQSGFVRRLSGVFEAFSANAGRGAAVIIAVLLTTPLLLMSRLANPVADDYAYFTNLEAAGSPLEHIATHYMTHNGRLAQNVVVTMSFVVFGKAAIQVIPALLLLGLAAAFGYLVYLLLPTGSRSVPLSAAIGATVTALGLFAMPSIFDTYLWFTSSTVYICSIIALVVNSCLAIKMARADSLPAWLLTLILCSMLLSQSFSEPAALLAVAAAGAWAVWEFVRKRWRVLLRASLSFVALVLGFLMVFFSPGTIARRAELDNPVSLRHVFLGALEHYPTLFERIDGWVVALVLFAALVIAMNIGPLASPIAFHANAFAIASLIFGGSTYLVFAASNFGSTYFPYRNFTLPTFGLIVAITVAAASLFKAVIDSVPLSGLGRLALPAALTLGAIALPGALSAAALQMKALGVRDSAVAVREIEVSKQLQSGASTIFLRAAPVLVVSEAVEVENPSVGQIPWLIEGVRAWYGIPAAREILVEGTGSTYCLREAVGVRSEFVCQ